MSKKEKESATRRKEQHRIKQAEVEKIVADRVKNQ
jgi:hypothetical protein